MIYFLDASAVVKKYIAEKGSDRLRKLVVARREFAIARLSQVEVPAALARRTRDGDLRRDLAERHARQFRSDSNAMQVVELRAPVLSLAGELIWAHPLRAFDALQLAAALHLKRSAQQALTFVAADGTLCDAAEREGLKVERLS